MPERIVAAAQYQAGSKQTKITAFRFGNVMGSSGSVLNSFNGKLRENKDYSNIKKWLEL